MQIFTQKKPSTIDLLGGGSVECDRGAELGDLSGPAQCVAVISVIMSRVHARLEEAEINLADVWYMDDGRFSANLMMSIPF